MRSFPVVTRFLVTVLAVAAINSSLKAAEGDTLAGASAIRVGMERVKREPAANENQNAAPNAC